MRDEIYRPKTRSEIGVLIDQARKKASEQIAEAEAKIAADKERRRERENRKWK